MSLRDDLLRRIGEWCDAAGDDESMPQALLDEWPNCAVPDCHNKCSLRLASIYCDPHTRKDAA